MRPVRERHLTGGRDHNYRVLTGPSVRPPHLPGLPEQTGPNPGAPGPPALHARDLPDPAAENGRGLAATPDADGTTGTRRTPPTPLGNDEIRRREPRPRRNDGIANRKRHPGTQQATPGRPNIRRSPGCTTGGNMPGGRSEERVIFTLLRDPEWTGFNRIPPMLRRRRNAADRTTGIPNPRAPEAGGSRATSIASEVKSCQPR